MGFMSLVSKNKHIIFLVKVIMKRLAWLLTVALCYGIVGNFALLNAAHSRLSGAELAAAKKRTPCLYYPTPTGCKYGDACEFSHAGTAAVAAHAHEGSAPGGATGTVPVSDPALLATALQVGYSYGYAEGAATAAPVPAQVPSYYPMPGYGYGVPPYGYGMPHQGYGVSAHVVIASPPLPTAASESSGASSDSEGQSSDASVRPATTASSGSVSGTSTETASVAPSEEEAVVFYRGRDRERRPSAEIARFWGQRILTGPRSISPRLAKSNALRQAHSEAVAHSVAAEKAAQERLHAAQEAAAAKVIADRSNAVQRAAEQELARIAQARAEAEARAQVERERVEKVRAEEAVRAVRLAAEAAAEKVKAEREAAARIALAQAAREAELRKEALRKQEIQAQKEARKAEARRLAEAAEKLRLAEAARAYEEKKRAELKARMEKAVEEEAAIKRAEAELVLERARATEEAEHKAAMRVKLEKGSVEAATKRRAAQAEQRALAERERAAKDEAELAKAFGAAEKARRAADAHSQPKAAAGSGASAGVTAAASAGTSVRGAMGPEEAFTIVSLMQVKVTRNVRNLNAKALEDFVDECIASIKAEKPVAELIAEVETGCAAFHPRTAEHFKKGSKNRTDEIIAQCRAVHSRLSTTLLMFVVPGFVMIGGRGIHAQVEAIKTLVAECDAIIAALSGAIRGKVQEEYAAFKAPVERFVSQAEALERWITVFAAVNHLYSACPEEYAVVGNLLTHDQVIDKKLLDGDLASLLFSRQPNKFLCFTMLNTRLMTRIALGDQLATPVAGVTNEAGEMLKGLQRKVKQHADMINDTSDAFMLFKQSEAPFLNRRAAVNVLAMAEQYRFSAAKNPGGFIDPVILNATVAQLIPVVSEWRTEKIDKPLTPGECEHEYDCTIKGRLYESIRPTVRALIEGSAAAAECDRWAEIMMHNNKNEDTFCELLSLLMVEYGEITHAKLPHFIGLLTRLRQLLLDRAKRLPVVLKSEVRIREQYAALGCFIEHCEAVKAGDSLNWMARLTNPALLRRIIVPQERADYEVTARDYDYIVESAVVFYSACGMEDCQLRGLADLLGVYVAFRTFCIRPFSIAEEKVIDRKFHFKQNMTRFITVYMSYQLSRGRLTELTDRSIRGLVTHLQEKGLMPRSEEVEALVVSLSA